MSRIQSDVARLMDDSGQRVGISRRPLLRIYEIHSAIQRGGYPNCTVHAEKIGVQPKTIQRDITFMRDKLKLPIVYQGALHGYFFRSGVPSLPDHP